MMTSTGSPNNLIRLRVEIERERRRRAQPGAGVGDLLAQYRDDPGRFINDLIIIDDAQPGEDTADLATMPFHLWDAQKELLGAVVSERLLLILKARQLGISWLLLAYALWLCLFRAGRLALVFSIGQAEANEMLRRVHVMYWRLPPEVRSALPSVLKDNTEEMAWDNGSRVLSLPARKTAGSGYTASLVILDEFAKNQWAREIYTAVKPTIDGGGKMVILSSAHGAGNLFHEMVEKAQQALGRFAFRFLPWWSRPGRDQSWYAAVAADAVDESHMKQEYPATPDEAFEATEVDAFLPSMALWDACLDPNIPPLSPHEPCILAVDGSESNDTFPLIIVSRHPLDPVRFAVRYVNVFVPIPGVVLDDSKVEAEVRRLVAAYAIQEVAYDRAFIGQLMRRLTTQAPGGPAPIAVPCEPFNQNQSRLVSDKELFDLITGRRLAHNGDPVLRAHIANANKKVDADGHIRIVKRTYALKVDGVVCLSMGCARAGELLEMPAPGFSMSYDTRTQQGRRRG